MATACCLRLSRVDLQSGNDEVAMDGLSSSVRYLREWFLNLAKRNYFADANVRKGYASPGNVDWCNTQPSGANWPIADANAAAFPLDRNMILASEEEDLE